MAMIQRDLLAPGALAEVVASVRPAVVVHCAAMTDVDACEQDPARAFACNARLSGDLARAVPPRCLVVYVSTDSVCQGSSAGATEQDPPAPATTYARSKLEGEQLVQEASRAHLIVRTNFYGWSSGRKRTFAEWLCQALESETSIRLFTDVWFTPIYVVDLAIRLQRLIEIGQRGVVHVGGRERLSKYDFGMLLGRTARLPTGSIVPSRIVEAGFAAPRPNDMSLSSVRCEQLTGVAAPRCSDGLQRFLRDRERPLSARFNGLHEDERAMGVRSGLVAIPGVRQDPTDMPV